LVFVVRQVEFIEQDSEVKISEFVTQPNATWGISRMSHRKPHATDYVYDSSAGEGTCAFILDTGINPDLAVRSKPREYAFEASRQLTRRQGIRGPRQDSQVLCRR